MPHMPVVSDGENKPRTSNHNYEAIIVNYNCCWLDSYTSTPWWNVHVVNHGNASNTFQFFETFVNCLLHTEVNVWHILSDKIWKSHLQLQKLNAGNCSIQFVININWILLAASYIRSHVCRKWNRFKRRMSGRLKSRNEGNTGLAIEQ